MNDLKQTLFAFTIPFIVGVGLAFAGDYFFFPGCTYTSEIQEEMTCISHPEYSTTLAETSYMFLVVGMFLTSLILPSFLTGRAYQNKRSKLEMKSIIE